MKRAHVGLLVVGLAALFGLPASAHAGGNTIAKSLGNVRWGMSKLELKSALKGKLPDSSYVEFNGRSSFDSRPVGEEYTHGNEEAMMSYRASDGSENYYFFIGGELWKWVKLYPASSFGGSDFDRFSASVKKRFGKGYEKEGEVNPGSGYRYKFLEYMDRNTRLRAVDKTERSGKFALMFESMDTVRSLSALRMNTTRRVQNKQGLAKASRRAAEEEDDDEEEAIAPSRPSKTRQQQPERQSSSFTLRGAKKGSIFEGEQQQNESEDQYQARKQRVVEEERAKQRRQHEKTEDTKKAKTLDELAGIDDDDPLSGMNNR